MDSRDFCCLVHFTYMKAFELASDRCLVLLHRLDSATFDSRLPTASVPREPSSSRGALIT